MGRRPKAESIDFPRAIALGRALERRRTEKTPKMSRRELARLSGVGESTIQAIEGGKVAEPGLFTIAALGIALDLDLGELMRTRTGPFRIRTLRAGQSWPMEEGEV